jgi:hypothetical protein
VVVTIGSDNPERPWALTASIKPTHNGYRSVALEARRVSASDLLLATRLDGGTLQTNLPVSASLHGEIGPDGVPESLTGRIVADAGYISDSNDADGRIDFDHAEFKINWDARDRTLAVPFQILSGGNRITLMGQVEAPAESPGTWAFKIGGGTAVLTSPATQGDPLVLNRISMSGRFDPIKRRFVLDGGDLGNAEVGVALSGVADYSSGELRLAAGAAATRMSVDSLKRLWPAFIAPKVRDWFSEHLIERQCGACRDRGERPAQHAQGQRSAASRRRAVGRCTGDECVIRPVQGLPALHDADLTVHIAGRNAQIAVGKATADLPSGRKLVLSSGLFEVPDTGAA